MRHTFLICFSVVALSFVAELAPADSPKKPNVLLIISDDQGYGDYGFMGHPIIETPHLDDLANRGLVFPNGYVVAPLCRPSLASIATGLYPHQHGICANDVDSSRRAESDLPLRKTFQEHPNLASILTAHGYLTFQSGKWWEGSWKQGGFTHGMTHGDPARGGRHGDAGLKIGRHGIQPLTNFIDDAVHENKPFFVWYAPFLPHTPHTPPAELLQKYKAEGRRENVAKYFAMCEWFDQTCGELLMHLNDRGIRENTIVAYVCDNGWAPVDPAAANPQGWWPDYAPRSKGSPFQLGIRTPMMISWPGSIPTHRSNDLASSIDLMPTILAGCNIHPPEHLPGINLLNDSERGGRHAVFGGAWSIHNMKIGSPTATLQYRYCVTRAWKLLTRHPGKDTTRYKTIHQWDREPHRLYDLSEDPLEANNVAEIHTEVVDQLKRRLDSVIPDNLTESRDS